MANPQDCPSFVDCDLNKLSLEQLFKRYLIVDDGTGCPTLKVNSSLNGPSVQALLTSDEVSVDGSIPAGTLSATLTTSSDFVGTINGETREPGAYVFQINGFLNPAIPYTISAGSIVIDYYTQP